MKVQNFHQSHLARFLVNDISQVSNHLMKVAPEVSNVVKLFVINAV